MNLQSLKETWISQGKTEILTQIWDRAASDYAKKPLPDFRTDSFLKLIAETGDLNSDISCLDVGCGAGGYSLALAPYVGAVTGVDLSSAMIKNAQKRAADSGISNASFCCLDWNSLDIHEARYYKNFDIVFARMTPAVSDYSTFDKMVQCSRNHCYFQKNTRRHDAVLDKALSLIHLPNGHEKADEDVVNCFAYLWLNGYEPQISYHQEVWRIEKSVEDTCAWCVDRAKLQKDISLEEEHIIREYISSVGCNKIVQETVTTTIVTMHWQVTK